MALEIKEIIVRAFVGHHKKDNDKEKNDADKSCVDNKDVHEKQDTMDALSEMMKNEKER